MVWVLNHLAINFFGFIIPRKRCLVKATTLKSFKSCRKKNQNPEYRNRCNEDLVTHLKHFDKKLQSKTRVSWQPYKCWNIRT